MKNTLLKILKVSLVVSLAILAILLIFGIVLALNWPWWVGFFITLGFAGMAIGWGFFRKILIRRREQRFVQQVIEQDNSQLKALQEKEKDNLQGIQDRWREAVEALKKSHLRKYGNPLYVLPWYLVIGESGSGKTTAISSAKLSSPFADVKKISGISGTRNCDWWFFEQAIILDTAGRYAIHVDEVRDKEEWQKFLNLLIKYRRKEPLNGLIITISADKLLESTPELIQQDGNNIRRRIDELMRALGVKFPIYLMVTKCDLVQGMTQFCDSLPEKSLDQPMGVINQDLSSDTSVFLNHVFTTIGERLRNLRILLVHQSRSKSIEPGLLLFPDEFGNLKPALESFMKGAFGDNPYQETPILRGLFFSSGRQEGTPYSQFLSALGLIGEKEVLPGTSKGLFLHDFFSKIIPFDRGLFAPTKRALEWRLITRNLGLTSWILFGVALCGLLSFSFVKNLKILREASGEFAVPSALHGEFVTDLNTMNRFSDSILSIEAQNHSWWFPRFGLYESVTVEKWLKEKYCSPFFNDFLMPFDKEIGRNISGFTSMTPDETIGQYIVHIIRRLNLFNGLIKGEDLETLKTKPQPSYLSVLPIATEGIEPEIGKTFGHLFLNYLAWRTDSGQISSEIEKNQSWLRHLLTLKDNHFWLVALANQEGSSHAITLKEFWGGSLTAAAEKSISPAFTSEGKKMIDSYMKEMEDALPDPLILSKSKAKFESWYRTATFEKWEDFGKDFMRGIEKLNGFKEWQQTAEKMSSDEGPYFSFLNKIALELTPLMTEESSPLWLQQVNQFQALKQAGKAGGGAVSNIAEKGLTIITKTFNKESGEVAESQLSAVRTYQEYQKMLSSCSSAATSRKQAYQMALQVYSENPASSESSFFSLQSAANKFKASMMNGSPAEGMFWELFMGPADYLWTFTRMETGCYLQNEWEEKVLSQTRGTDSQQMMQSLSGKGGPVWEFINGPLKPFAGWSIKRGYYAKEADMLGGTVPLKTSFLSFLEQSAHVSTPKQNYAVTIKGLPTDVNSEAKLKPHETHLKLKCTGAAESQSLTNKNYPTVNSFNWSPETCSDVTLEIKVGNVVLTKNYSGAQAFPNFLLDFKGGNHMFYPQDFPKEETYLKRIGIDNIKVNYEFRGAADVIKLNGALPDKIPGSITWCWEK